MINPMELTGKHIVVTGASSGIGAETARHIARLGGKVSLIARNEEKLQSVIDSMEGEGHQYFLVDLSNPENIAGNIKEIFQKQGRFDGGVYCAGVDELCPLRMVKPTRIARIAATNYLSYVEFVRCITQKQYRAEQMSIVGISSVASKRGEKGKVMYCSSKAAIDGAMRAMAHELASDNIRVNNILPGWVRTDMYESYINALGKTNIEKEFDMIQYIGKPLETIDIANAAVFLLSDAGRFITGTEMVVAGGCLT